MRQFKRYVPTFLFFCSLPNINYVYSSFWHAHNHVLLCCVQRICYMNDISAHFSLSRMFDCGRRQTDISGHHRKNSSPHMASSLCDGHIVAFAATAKHSVCVQCWAKRTTNCMDCITNSGSIDWQLHEGNGCDGKVYYTMKVSICKNRTEQCRDTFLILQHRG